jgi:hypothetical protein
MLNNTSKNNDVFPPVLYHPHYADLQPTQETLNFGADSYRRILV